ncbi:MAG: carbon-nitrogen hydrolase family protein [Thalassobaculales bacterium]
MEVLRVALWPVGIGRRLEGLGAWLAALDARAAEAAGRKAALLVLPEYACQQWLTFAPPSLRPEGEIAWLARLAPAALSGARAIARRHGLAILAGTMPEPAAGGFRNTACFLAEDGTIHRQAKLVLTPFERDPAAWTLVAGDAIHPFRWRGLTVAVMVCLDVEQPGLAAALLARAPDLVLVPSQTALASGYHRVAACARARAVELCCPVATVGTAGRIAWNGQDEPNTGGAAAYLPAETVLGSTGIALDSGPLDADPDRMFVADLPVGRCRALRQSGAEVWVSPLDA